MKEGLQMKLLNFFDKSVSYQFSSSSLYGDQVQHSNNQVTESAPGYL